MDRPGPRVDRRFDRHARSHERAERSILVQDDLDGNALHDLGEVARGVIGREQGEGAPGARRPALDMACENEIGEGVDGDACGLTDAHIRHLRLLVVRDHPDIGQRDDGNDLRADVDELAGADLALADETIGW